LNISQLEYRRPELSRPRKPEPGRPAYPDLNERGVKIVISQHPRRASPLPIDADINKWRQLIENFFCKLKEFKRMPMRADKPIRASLRTFVSSQP
jgi:hypothetical protein